MGAADWKRDWKSSDVSEKPFYLQRERKKEGKKESVFCGEPKNERSWKPGDRLTLW